MERRENWYSIIQYMPNKLRGEVINVGVLLHDPNAGELIFKLIDETNPKIRAFFNNSVLSNVYKASKEYVDYYLNNISNENTMFEKGKLDSLFLHELKGELPDGFILSDPSFSLTSNPKLLFEQLLINYIGKEFIEVENQSNQVSTRKHLNDFFKKRKLLDTKVKTNARIKPIEDIKNMHYIIDFVYKNGVLNLIQTVPTNPDRLNDWFSKINTFSRSYNKNAEIYLVYEKNLISNQNNTIVDMFSYFEGNDKRIKTIELKSKALIDLSRDIQEEGKYIEEFEAELA